MDEVKVYPGNPPVVTMTRGPIIAAATIPQMLNAGRPLKEIVMTIVDSARKHGGEIFHEYDYPHGKWFPCGTADIVLMYNDTRQRELINLFKKEGRSRGSGRDSWEGWFGRLSKVSRGFWWSPPMRGTQSMLFQEEVCRFIRQKLLEANIAVQVRTWID